MTISFERGSQILVVDDEELNRIPLMTLLEAEGYGVLEADSGQAALHLLKSETIDLVLLDVVMPQMDGFAVCRHIREQLENLTLPVIFTTALHDRDSRLRGKDVGGDDFLTKPVDPVELIVRVRNLLKVKAFYDQEQRRKEALSRELQETRDQLIRANQLATLGNIASCTGHELQNLYGVYNATLAFLTTDIAQGKPPGNEDIETLQTIRVHLKNHADQLLHLGRPELPTMTPLDFRTLISDTVQILALSGKTRKTKLCLSFPETPVIVTVDRVRIQQVLLNLLCNAIDAITEHDIQDGRIDVELVLQKDPQGVCCAIRNNGPPVPENLLERIFEPYFTTRKKRGGTGLGLNVVQHIVNANRGTIICRNPAKGGVQFTMFLPLQIPAAET